MARSPSIHKHPRPKRPQHEERPVLQLPLARPDWREPVIEDEDKTPERGVAVVDFYI